MTANEIENQPREPKFGTPFKISVYIKILVIFYISCHQLSTAGNS